jgi:hypothetical protein
LLFALAVGAALVLPPVAASAASWTPSSSAAVGSSAAAPCTRTVSGFTASAVHSARDQAGVGGIVCFPAGSYTGSLNANVARQTWRLDDNSILKGSVYITGAGMRLLNGQSVLPSGNRWIASVEIRADDVTVQSVLFDGGGAGVGVYGKDRAQIRYNTFKKLSGSAVSIWSEGVGADDTVIYHNRISQTITSKVSPITSRGNESAGHGGVQNVHTVIYKNTIDQGAGDIGWFGIELKQSKKAVVQSNYIKGGTVLLSLPETDNALIRYNTFDLRGSPHWAIEVGNAYDAVILKNKFIGDGPTGKDYAVILNTNPLRTIVRYNYATDIRTLFAIAGDGHRVLDNCLLRVLNIQEFALNGGPNIIFDRNGPC